MYKEIPWIPLRKTRTPDFRASFISAAVVGRPESLRLHESSATGVAD